MNHAFFNPLRSLGSPGVSPHQFEGRRKNAEVGRRCGSLTSDLRLPTSALPPECVKVDQGGDLDVGHRTSDLRFVPPLQGGRDFLGRKPRVVASLQPRADIFCPFRTSEIDTSSPSFASVHSISVFIGAHPWLNSGFGVKVNQGSSSPFRAKNFFCCRCVYFVL
jgi:hypothetical protein